MGAPSFPLDALVACTRSSTDASSGGGCQSTDSNALPNVSLPHPSWDEGLPAFPRAELPDLVAYVDAARATDLKMRRSASGMVFVLAGGARLGLPPFGPN